MTFRRILRRIPLILLNFLWLLTVCAHSCFLFLVVATIVLFLPESIIILQTIKTEACWSTGFIRGVESWVEAVERVISSGQNSVHVQGQSRHHHRMLNLGFIYLGFFLGFSIILFWHLINTVFLRFRPPRVYTLTPEFICSHSCDFHFTVILSLFYYLAFSL